MISAPADRARVISSSAACHYAPVPIDWAEAAMIPVASSSVSEALNTAATSPKRSTNRRDLVAPIPGVNASASHCSVRSSATLIGASAV